MSQPTNRPTDQPTNRPTDQPTNRPSDQAGPTSTDTGAPARRPSCSRARAQRPRRSHDSSVRRIRSKSRSVCRSNARLGARPFGAIIAALPFADSPCVHPDSINSTNSTATSSRYCRRTPARASRISRGNWTSRARPCSRGSRGSSARR
ncbi:PT domain-containing protein [Burkholderia sp. MSMB617WGS]|uniref:PT domain-containing protein n=1 Tax=Burkholderia sp. MSMB617WGS TaxID=1637831 RepID=UPI001F27605F|nr:PT domain-containing protein [Burkholderia sp. MSMB617WGS]